MLHKFITTNREEIIARCRAKVAGRSIPPPTAAEIDHGVPLFLDQVVRALRLGLETSPEIDASAGLHGHDLMLQGLTVAQVVHDYGNVCQSVTELAMETGAAISTEDFHALNRALDDAIASAVTTHGRAQTQSGIDDEASRGEVRLGFFAHELRNLLNTATMAFRILKSGDVGVGGSTGQVLERSLAALGVLITRSLAEVRLAQGVQNRTRLSVASFLSDLTPAATLEGLSRGIPLTVTAVAEELIFEADAQVLGAAISNLLQNAFKFTKPGTTVTLRAGASPERILIEVQDQCGGLPGGEESELFHPFEQRGTDRTGLGLGLAFSRWGVEGNGGRLYGRNLPGVGCVFTIDLPRVHAGSPSPAAVG